MQLPQTAELDSFIGVTEDGIAIKHDDEKELGLGSINKLKKQVWNGRPQLSTMVHV